VSFHPLPNEEYWSPYIRLKFIADPRMRRNTCINNEMDQLDRNKPKNAFTVKMKDTIRAVARIDNKLSSFVNKP